MECAVAIAAKISEYTIEAICNQLGYVVFYNINMKGLKEQLDALVYAKSRVQHLIDEAKDNAEDIESLVQIWLVDADEVVEKAYRFLIKGEVTKKNGWIGSSFNLVQRYKSSKKAKKMANGVARIHKQGKFDKVSYHGPLPRIENSGYQIFESRMSTVKHVIEALRHPNISMIGVYGMGGIGKTMLVKEIAKDVQKERLFETVIIATIGKNLNVENIQGQLGDMLKLHFGQETKQGRAALLHKRLRTEKKILIILDDLWNRVDLETIGIPCSDGYEGCKIVVTSRSKHVLSCKMGIEKNFELKSLRDEEAEKFFKNTAGEYVEFDHEMNKIATKVAKKCGKLPLAIITVGKALKDKSFPIWRDALRQLKNPLSVDIEGVSNEVYASLKLSYDYLCCKDARKLFLLCSIFPDDHDIDVENLVRYAMGLKFVQGADTLQTTKDRILKLVDDLKSCCLLQSFERYGNSYVTVHDIVRDVAIYIASKNNQIHTLSYAEELNEWKVEDTHGHYTIILANCVNFQHLPERLSFPNLELLALVDKRYRVHFIHIPEGFF